MAEPSRSRHQGRALAPDKLQRLVYGNILEALDTDLFGKNVARSQSQSASL